MAHSFKSIPGNKSFGVFSEPLDAGEYISNKKARASFCVANNCVPAVKVGTQSNLLLFNKSNKLSLYPCKNSINKANLNINLITQLDLSGVPVILDESANQVPCPINGINSSILPYLIYNIDPAGKLFGNNVCGINNYVRYMVYTQPIKDSMTTVIDVNEPYIINGGTSFISSDSNYNTIITFTNTANRNSIIRLNREYLIDVTIVGGGGGGGGGQPDIGKPGGGGGGGGGEVLKNTIKFTPSTYTIIIGKGGKGGNGNKITDPDPYGTITTPVTDGSSGSPSQIISTNNTIINANGGNGGFSYYSYDFPSQLCDGGASGSGSQGGRGGMYYGDAVEAGLDDTIEDNGYNAPLGGGGGGGGSYFDGNGGHGSAVIGTSFGGGGGGGGADFQVGHGVGGVMYNEDGSVPYNEEDGSVIGNPNAGNGGNPPTAGKDHTGCGGGGGGYVAGADGGSGVIILAFNV